MDAFALLGLPPTMELDMATLERRYRDLQKQLHPDKFVDAAPSARRESLSRAVAVNDAYRVLRDEISRAETILSRHQPEGGEGREREADPALLMEIMELREQLSEAKAARDLRVIAKLSAQVNQQQKEAREALYRALAELSEPSSDAALSRAKSALAQLRYYRRFQEEVALAEEHTLS